MSAEEKSEKEVFITYSWDDEEHKENVLGFFNFLRESGFNTDIDRKLAQEETAKDFTRMMHSAMTDYQKVIIVLSPQYKTKADQFKSGVGKEYSLIINDIEANPNKYILVSFSGRPDDIIPIGFKGRDIVDLSEPGSRENLFRKLQDIPEIGFSDVADKKPVLTTRQIASFNPTGESKSASPGDLSVKKIFASLIGGKSFARLYYDVEYNLRVLISNDTEEIIREAAVELVLPKDLTNYNSPGRIDGDMKVYNADLDRKLFPGQVHEINLGNLKVTNRYADLAFESSIQVILHSKFGRSIKDFPIKDYLIVSNSSSYRPELLTIENFHDKGYLPGR